MGYPHYPLDCFQSWPTWTICGSMRFYPLMLKVAERETLEGKIILMPFVRKDAEMDSANLDYQIKLAREGSVASMNDALDQLHKLKIDLSRGIFVVSDGSGYIGDSTRSEIEYTAKQHKRIIYCQEA